MCCIAIVNSAGIFAAAAVFITLSGFLAVVAHGFYPLGLGILLAVAFYFWRQHRAALVVVTDRENRTAKRSGWVMLLAALFPSLFG